MMTDNAILAINICGIFLLCGWPHSRAVHRLWATACDATPVSSHGVKAQHIGIAALLASLVSHFRSGGIGLEPFLDIPSAGSIVPRLPAEPRAMRRAITAMVARHALNAESNPRGSASRIINTADGITVAHRLSLVLGCEEVRCIEAVAANHRRSVMIDALRDAAYAVPKATVNLLLALPFATLVLEELSGANPVGFLIGSPRGMLCLLLGFSAYAIGAAWMRHLMASVPDGEESLSHQHQAAQDPQRG